MGFHHWLRPPRHLLVLFLAVTIVPAAALIYLGWRTVGQDQDLERQHLIDRLGISADAIAASLGRDLDDIAAGFPRAFAPAQGGADAAGTMFVALGADGVEQHSGAPLLYVPALPVASEPPDSVWSFGETDEYQRRDYANAADTFAGLAGSADPRVRAGALVRLARVRRKQQQMESALKAYADLTALGSVPVGGDPAELVGRQARAALLAEMGRIAESRQEAARLFADLQRGRFTIDRATYLADRMVLERLTGVFDVELIADAGVPVTSLSVLYFRLVSGVIGGRSGPAGLDDRSAVQVDGEWYWVARADFEGLREGQRVERLTAAGPVGPIRLTDEATCPAFDRR